MSDSNNGWIWFVVLLVLITAGGVFFMRLQRPEPVSNIVLSMEDEYRQVDPALIRYVEIDPVVPTLGKLSALAVAPDGKLYVGGLNGIEIFPGGQKIELTGTPSCLTVDEEGLIFVGFQEHFMIFSNDGKPIRSIAPGPKTFLTSMAVDDKFIYAADAGNRCVLRYGKTGDDRREIGRKDEAHGVRGFNVPSPFFDLDVGTDGSVWVVNPGYHAFENFSPDGRLISSWDKTGFRIEAFSGCCNPAHFALMPDGSFLTAEKGLPRVKIHNLDGSLRCVVVAPDQLDKEASGLDVAVDSKGLIYVLDPGRGKVRIFQEKP